MRILLIDDDVEIAHVITLILCEGGHDVLTAQHGRQAIEVLAGAAPPGLILLDLMMPQMNGWDFRRWQQQQASLARIPVVLLSGAATLKASAEALDVADYLRKPFDCDQLLATVDKLAAPAALLAQPLAPSLCRA